MEENYFSFYDLPISVSPDSELLRKKYLEVSRKCHPDFFRTGSEADRAEAERLSAFNNRAYTTLKDPFKTVTHIFRLKGLLSESGENLTNIRPSGLFLSEMMDLNERIEEVNFAGNPAATEALLAELQPMIAKKEAELFRSTEFALHPDRAEDPAFLKKAFNLYLEQKYLLRIRESLTNIAA